MTARVHSTGRRASERKDSTFSESSGDHHSRHSGHGGRRNGRRGRSKSAPRLRREDSPERSFGPSAHSSRRQSAAASVDLAVAVPRDHRAPKPASIPPRTKRRSRHSGTSGSGARSVCSVPTVCSRANPPPPPPPRKSKSTVSKAHPPPPPVKEAVLEDDNSALLDSSQGTESTHPSTDVGSDDHLPRRAASHPHPASNSSGSKAPSAAPSRRSSSVSRASTRGRQSSSASRASGRSASASRRAASRGGGRFRSRSASRTRYGQAVRREELMNLDNSLRRDQDTQDGGASSSATASDRRFRLPSRSKMEGRSLSRGRFASRQVRGGRGGGEDALLLDGSARSGAPGSTHSRTHSSGRSESRGRRYRQTDVRDVGPRRSPSAGSRRSASASRSAPRPRRVSRGGGARRSPSPAGSRHGTERRSRSFGDWGGRSPEPRQDYHQDYNRDFPEHPQGATRSRGSQESPLDRRPRDDDDHLPPASGAGNEINLVIDAQGRGKFHIAARSPSHAPAHGNGSDGHPTKGHTNSKGGPQSTSIHPAHHQRRPPRYLTFDIQIDEPSQRYLIHTSMGRLDAIRAMHPGMNILRTLSYWNNLQKRRYGDAPSGGGGPGANGGNAGGNAGGGDPSGAEGGLEGGRLGIVSRDRTNLVMMTLMGQYAHRMWESDPIFQRELERFVEDALQFHACLNDGEGEGETWTSEEDDALEERGGGGGGGASAARRGSPERRGSSAGETDASERSRKGAGRGKLLGKVFGR